MAELSGVELVRHVIRNYFEEYGYEWEEREAFAALDKLERDVEAWRRLSRRWATRAREAEAKLEAIRTQFEEWFPEVRDA